MAASGSILAVHDFFGIYISDQYPSALFRCSIKIKNNTTMDDHRPVASIQPKRANSNKPICYSEAPPLSILAYVLFVEFPQSCNLLPVQWKFFCET